MTAYTLSSTCKNIQHLLSPIADSCRCAFQGRALFTVPIPGQLTLPSHRNRAKHQAVLQPFTAKCWLSLKTRVTVFDEIKESQIVSFVKW